jgi:hypothetical protein
MHRLGAFAPLVGFNSTPKSKNLQLEQRSDPLWRMACAIITAHLKADAPFR